MFHQEAMESTENIDENKLEEMEKYILSESQDYAMISLLIQLNLEELFQKALNSPQYLRRVQDVVDKMSRHPDFTTRLLLMKKLPRLALLCFGENQPQYVRTRLWPLLMSCLNDKNEEVRKACEISLIVLMKGKLLEQETIDEKVCPCIVEICKTDGYSSTVALMGKMVPFIGKDVTKKHFLDVFVSQCSKEGYELRKKCVKSLGELCAVLGTETTEKYLLGPFIKLCRDENWEVRACCPEVAIPVSCTCSLVTRKTVLADAFADLLKDGISSVRMSAYAFLGAFICTFADPSVTKLDYDEDGDFIFVGQEGYKFRLDTVYYNYPRDGEWYDDLLEFGKKRAEEKILIGSSSLLFLVQNDTGPLRDLNSGPNYLDGSSSSSSSSSSASDPSAAPSSAGLSWTSEDNSWWGRSQTTSPDDQEANDLYNTFRFWRTPLDELDSFDLAEPEQDDIRTDLNMLDNELSSLSEKLAECSADDLEDGSKTESESPISCASSSDSGWNSAETTPHVELIPSADSKVPDRDSQAEMKSPDDLSKVSLPDQDVVPQVLLDSFVSMTSPLQGDAFDKEMAQDYAYCLPAVALTLGPNNWPYIKNAYKCLSMNIQWRVRKTAVSSIHKLAMLVGEEVASKDLAPIFENFSRDLDEVKIGALEHLADFLKLVRPSTRNTFLPRLKDFLEMEFDYNWRYREEFGEQLRLLISLYSPSDWVDYFEPLATLLLCDKVAAVRHKAVILFLELIVNLSCNPEYQEKLLGVLLKEFAENSSWRRRQVFVYLCSEMARQKALDETDFCRILLDSLLVLSRDAIPNVGLCVAKCLSSDILSTGYISPSSPHFKTIIDTLEKLKCDDDPDVRYFASEWEQQQQQQPQQQQEPPSPPTPQQQQEEEQQQPQQQQQAEHQKVEDNS